LGGEPNLPKGIARKVRIASSEVVVLAFTGKDTSSGKSFAAWVKKYNEKTAASEKNIGTGSESSDEE